jgi:hypothetical protein
MKGRTGHKEPKKTIGKSVVKAAKVRLKGGHFGGDGGHKYKHGGKVGGKKPHARPDKRARGGLVDNDEIVGLKDTGESTGDNKEPKTGYAKGGGIKIKPSHKGLLHKDLGVKSGEKIPEKKLEKAKNSSDPAVRKRATFAENAKHWHH